ncbi:MAG TPA: FeoB-associated Cys-rich membrane protein [Bacteroidia bacterium]|nr:FeoB-associated Cys-rich membrane protein [Bacteroidia bacterium]
MQFIILIVLFSLCLVYLGWRVMRPMVKKKTDCGDDCKCQ